MVFLHLNPSTGDGRIPGCSFYFKRGYAGCGALQTGGKAAGGQNGQFCGCAATCEQHGHKSGNIDSIPACVKKCNGASPPPPVGRYSQYSRCQSTPATRVFEMDYSKHCLSGFDQFSSNLVITSKELVFNPGHDNRGGIQ